MKVIFEYNGVKSSKQLEDKTLKKLNKLSDKYSFIIRSIVSFKTERTHARETGKICTIRISAPGPFLFAESTSSDFERAMLNVVQELESQLSKKKGKLQAH